MATGDSSQFAWYDWLTFAVVLAISFIIGIYHAVAGNKTTGQYFSGSRSLGLVPVTMSTFMSYISGITVLGNSAEFYMYGAQQWVTNILGMCIGYILTSVIMVPLFYHVGLLSSYEYLERRFKSVAVKRFATVLAVIAMVLNMAVATYSPAVALNAVSPIPTWVSILATGVISGIYTSIGGMKAVIWTDFFQGAVLLLGLIALIIAGTVRMGGISDCWQAASQMGRTQFFDFNVDPLMRQNFWSILAGSITMGIQYGVRQASIQRYVTLPSKAQAIISILLATPLYALVWSLSFVLGILIFGYYHLEGCDPLRTGVIYSPNQLASYFALNALQVPVLPGIFVSVLFAGALSTVSSCLNAATAVIWKDFFAMKFKDISERNKTIISKILAAIVGAVSIGLAFLVESLPGHIGQVTSILLGTLGAPIGVFFYLAALFPFVNIPGLMAGILASIAMGCALTVGGYIYTPYIQSMNTTVENCADLGFNVTSPIPQNPTDVPSFFRLSFLVYITIAMATGILVGVIASLLTGCGARREVEPELIIPIFDVLFCYLPRSWRVKLWCGVDHHKKHDAKDEDISYIKTNDKKLPPDSSEMVDVNYNQGFTGDDDKKGVNGEASMHRRPVTYGGHVYPVNGTSGEGYVNGVTHV